MFQFLIEAITVGILTCVVGMFLLFVTRKNYQYKMTENIMILFTTGVIIHVGCELFGVNKWYCRHGYACRQK